MKTKHCKGMKWAAIMMVVGVMALLEACGGGDAQSPAPPPPVTGTPLPASLNLSPVTSQVEPGTSVALASDLGDGREGLSFEWRFGDGTGSTEARPQHAFAAVGRYAVSLTVRNASGASISASATVQVGRFSIVKDRLCSGSGAAGWCWQQPLPSGGGVADVFFLDAVRGWAVGQRGLFMTTTDAGAHWQRQPVPMAEDFHRIRFADALNGWATSSAGYPGTEHLWRTSDGGASWRKLSDLPIDTVLRLELAGPDTLVAASIVGRGQQVAISVDGGLHWQAKALGDFQLAKSGALFGVSYDEPQTLYRASSPAAAIEPLLACGTSCSIVAYETDDGVNLSVLREETGDVCRIGEWSCLRLHRSSDGGQHWTSVSVSVASGASGTTAGKWSLHAGGGGWASSSSFNGTLLDLLHTRDGGQTWDLVDMPPSLRGASFVSALDGQTAAVQSGGIWLTSDGGQHWRKLDIPADPLQEAFSLERVTATVWRATAGPQSVSAANPGHGTSFDPQRTFVSVDSGLQWRALPTRGTTADVTSSIAFADPRRGFALNQGSNVLWTTEDGGLNWDVRYGPSFGGAGVSRDLEFANADFGFALVGGELVRTQDGGKTWAAISMPSNVSGTLRHAQFVDPRNGWTSSAECQTSGDIVLCTSALYATGDGGQTWVRRPDLLGDIDDHLFRFIDSRTGVLVRADGRMQRSVDGGQTWEAATVDRPSASAPLQLQFIDAQQGWLLRRDAQAPLLRTTDGGRSWRAMAWPTGQPAPAGLRFLDAQHGWVVGAGGSILSTDDGGATWLPQYSGTGIDLRTVFAIDPYTAWIGGAGSILLATATGGR